MGLLSNTVSICQFRVAGTAGGDDLPSWAGERLAANAFRSIEKGADELSVGWVHLDDPRLSDFSDPQAYVRDHYLNFALRRDQRRLPAALFKAHLARAEEDFLAANPGLSRVPKAKREELREAVRGALLARTLPVPGIWDAVWDTRRQVVTFAALSPKVVDLFETLFKQTFDGLRLVAITPFERARKVVPAELAQSLERANQAAGEGILEEIRDNQWLGAEFLLWLAWRALTGAGDYQVRGEGPALAGEGFAAWLDDRLVLTGGAEGGQKVAVTGPQDRFDEVRTALAGEKSLAEAVLHLEKGESAWRLNLKAPTFHFASFRCPGVKLEKDALTDAESERIAVFFERMALLEEGQQLFDSLLRDFLTARLDSGWPELAGRIRTWLEQED
jgi:hypothetical protein